MLPADAGKSPAAGIVKEIAACTQFLRSGHAAGLFKVLGVEF
jgi:hypothetical protein